MFIDTYAEPVGYRASLTVLPSRLGGLGVFTEQDIKPGEIIERAPATLVAKLRLVEYDNHNQPCGLAPYLFGWDLIPLDNGNDKLNMRSAFAHGSGSIYNHQHDRNAVFSTQIAGYNPNFRNSTSASNNTQSTRSTPTVTFRAIKAIPAGTEITISYVHCNSEELEIELFEKHWGKYHKVNEPLTPAPVESLNQLDRARFESWCLPGQYGDAHLEGILERVLAFKPSQPSK